MEGLGSVCSYSLFDLDKYGSVRYGGIATPSSSTEDTTKGSSSGGALEDGSNAAPAAMFAGTSSTSSSSGSSSSSVGRGGQHQHVPHDGKVEKSYLNFRVNYPEWKSPLPAGDAMLSRLQAFQVGYMYRDSLGRRQEIEETMRSHSH